MEINNTIYTMLNSDNKEDIILAIGLIGEQYVERSLLSNKWQDSINYENKCFWTPSSLDNLMYINVIIIGQQLNIQFKN